MAKFTFSCVDAHTCGNPVRVVMGGGPQLSGASMSERRQHFLAEFDWIRTGLMFEPRGHDMMSGSILYPPTRPDCDASVLFIETSGCLPMCGHGTIGTVTVAIERGLVRPATPGRLVLDTPAGVVVAEYGEKDGHVDWVKITNVPAFLFAGAAGTCADSGHARRQLPRERLGTFGTMELDVDGGERIAGLPVGGIAGESEQVRQVEPDLEPLAGEADGVGHRLVGAGDAELARVCAGGFAGQFDDVADLQVARGQKLAGEEDGGQFRLCLRRRRAEPVSQAARATPSATAGATLLLNTLGMMYSALSSPRVTHAASARAAASFISSSTVRARLSRRPRTRTPPRRS